ncbi:DMT family transporter [Paenibacillus hexagrammi]|uniref:DMT family transporter n=1 Tax=Paenibacillus hexagrammi TaxID=2908839 RepID=A0ABY3SNP0_9BACL|nr:DMT family transporter [Paenibacillus sp. YPD9-1]UJF35678.1 DMT family transporter [Paenibacillus sp. YPD9-1]
MSTSKTYSLALLYAFIIGFSFLFTKLALEVADPIDMLAYRFIISFGLIAGVTGSGWLRLNLPWRQVWRLLPIGLMYPAMFFSLQAFGLVHATSSEGGIFQASNPIFTLVLASVFLKERTSWLQKGAVVCSVAGVLYILLMEGASLQGSSLSGMVLLLLSSLSLSAYGVMARSLTRSFTPIQLTYVMMLIGMVAFTLLSLARHTASGEWKSLVEPLRHGGFISSILYIGVLSSLVSSLLSNMVLSKLQASQMSVFINLGTLVSILAGVVFLNEQLTYYHIIGAAVIIFGVIGSNIGGTAWVQRISASRRHKLEG